MQAILTLKKKDLNIGGHWKKKRFDEGGRDKRE